MYHRPHWSYSSISQYLACPLRYYFQRILCLPQSSISCGLVLGSSVHAVLAEYHRSIQENKPAKVERLHKVFSENWSSRENKAQVLFKDGENPKDCFDQGIALVELYLKEPPPKNIVSIEKEVISPVHNSKGEFLETPLVAVADLITEENNGLTVREFKTAARAYSGTETETSLQPTCYVNAVQEVFGKSASVEYTVLIKTKTPKIQRLKTLRNENDLARLGDIIENIERAIHAKVFYPIDSVLNCSGCPYRQPCREWGRTECSSLTNINFNPARDATC